MANPAQVACAADSWTKIMTNKTEGRAWIQFAVPPLKTLPPVYVAWVDTGGTAPSDTTGAVRLTDGVIEFSRSAASDVYVYPEAAALNFLVDA